MIIHVSSSRRSRPTNGRSFLPSPRSSHHWNGKSATTKGKITTHTTTECAGDGVVIGEECRYEKWLECDEICQSRKRHNRTEKCCTKFHSPRIVMRASSIKNTRAAWLSIKLSNLILILIALMLGWCIRASCYSCSPHHQLQLFVDAGWLIGFIPFLARCCLLDDDYFAAALPWRITVRWDSRRRSDWRRYV
jgi:hypothetical protein